MVSEIVSHTDRHLFPLDNTTVSMQEITSTITDGKFLFGSLFFLCSGKFNQWLERVVASDC